MAITPLKLRHNVVRLEKTVPPALRPLVRAYVLGYASSTVPRLLTLLIAYLDRRRKNDDGNNSKGAFNSLFKILKSGLHWQRFPTFCAVLVGGSTLLEIPIRRIVGRLLSNLSFGVRLRITRWLSTFAAAWLGMSILHSKESEAFIDRVPPNTFSAEGYLLSDRHFAGRTMDLTLFALTRGLDVVVGGLWDQRRTRRINNNSWSKLDVAVSKLADPSIFATSCAAIMWAWVYVPERLNKGYSKWITGAAQIDQRLLIALQRCRWGELKYGQDTGQGELLLPICKKFGYPEEWADLSKVWPIPCDMVHMGTGHNCEYHALSRFVKGFLMATGIYIPLNVAVQIRNPTRKQITRAFVGSMRSSAFLGSFIALFYYGVCLARSRIGPLIIGKDAKARTRIDAGMCIASGCMLCGWSILLENAGRRKDIGLFVAPRAMATILPRRYEMRYQWRETLAFAMSAAVVFTCVQENPKRVRGVFGRLLERVLEQ